MVVQIVNDTVFHRKDAHSAEITRQYCGKLDEQNNRRVVVNVATDPEQVSLPAACQLYPAGEMDQRRPMAPENRYARRDSLPDQAGDGARTDTPAGERGCSARSCTGRYRLLVCGAGCDAHGVTRYTDRR